MLRGGTLGYLSAAALPTIPPIAGLISGISLSLILSQVGKYISGNRSAEINVKMMDIVAITVTIVASATLTFLSCLALNIPISFTACLIFPWHMSLVSALILMPLVIAHKAYDVYLKLRAHFTA